VACCLKGRNSFYPTDTIDSDKYPGNAWLSASYSYMRPEYGVLHGGNMEVYRK
jgi:hypothetical protein